MEPTLQKGHSMNHFNEVHKFIPMQQQAVNIPDAKAAVEKEWEKSSKRSKLGSWIRSRAKRKVLWQHEETQAKSTFATLMDLWHLKNAESGQTIQKCKGRVVLRSGDMVQDDSGAYAVFIEQGSSASQITAAKVMDVIARLPD